jgi:hypothetical protein
MRSWPLQSTKLPRSRASHRRLPPAPDPDSITDPAIFVLRQGSSFVRCHDSSYGANEFNPRRDISQRFRPFVARGRTVPTLYGSDELIGALSETLFHLLPPEGPSRRIRASRLLAWLSSTLAPRRDLRLVDLRDEALEDHPLGLTRADLIDSPATAYPETAEWASAYFHAKVEPDGLVWNARQDRNKLAFVLFARGRVARSDLAIVEAPLSLFTTGFERVLEVAEEAGITIVR